MQTSYIVKRGKQEVNNKMKRGFIKPLALLLLCAMLLTAFGCTSKNKPSSVREGTVIGGKEFFFIDDATKQEWIEPIARLLSNELTSYGADGEILGYKPAIDEKLPTVPQSLSCGLLDLTGDGTPELLVKPFGAFGSSGMTEYFVYNIYTGQRLGKLDDGMGDSWCLYYNTALEYVEPCAQYWHRMGAFGYEYYMHDSGYDDAYMEIYTPERLHASYSIKGDANLVDGVEIEYIEPPKNSLYDDSFIANCLEIDYYVNTTKVEEAQYLAKCDEISSTLIKIPETALVMLDWSDVSDDEDDYSSRAKKMANALVNTEQKFIAS